MSIAELLVILIVALIVIKPERLPEIARILGRLVARFRRYHNHISEKMNSWLGMSI
jgi:sec-independent protein translocase protein TatB